MKEPNPAGEQHDSGRREHQRDVERSRMEAVDEESAGRPQQDHHQVLTRGRPEGEEQ